MINEYDFKVGDKVVCRSCYSALWINERPKPFEEEGVVVSVRDGSTYKYRVKFDKGFGPAKTDTLLFLEKEVFPAGEPNYEFEWE